MKFKLIIAAIMISTIFACNSTGSGTDTSANTSHSVVDSTKTK